MQNILEKKKKKQTTHVIVTCTDTTNYCYKEISVSSLPIISKLGKFFGSMHGEGSPAQLTHILQTQTSTYNYNSRSQELQPATTNFTNSRLEETKQDMLVE